MYDHERAGRARRAGGRRDGGRRRRGARSGVEHGSGASQPLQLCVVLLVGVEGGDRFGEKGGACEHGEHVLVKECARLSQEAARRLGEDQLLRPLGVRSPRAAARLHVGRRGGRQERQFGDECEEGVAQLRNRGRLGRRRWRAVRAETARAERGGEGAALYRHAAPASAIAGHAAPAAAAAARDGHAAAAKAALEATGKRGQAAPATAPPLPPPPQLLE
mmetsp:Transcript_17597/g.41749  ORF Transcript_17597/g.41749 Transcript_17597/m.41749 type:complete len:219 (+) Transcript_17597:1567-2223(+)